MKNEATRNFGLDLIRAIAIGFVIAAHSVNVFQPLGVLGVELFFVLSGYLVGGIFLRNVAAGMKQTSNSVFNFWIRRWMRTMPNYYIFLMVFYLVALFENAAPSPVELIPYMFFLQNLAWEPPGFFELSWSLTIEEWFYLLLPSAVLLASFTVGRGVRAFLVGSLILILIGIVSRSLLANSDLIDSIARKAALARMDSLGFGCLIAYMREVYPGVFKIFQAKVVVVLVVAGAVSISGYVFWSMAAKTAILSPVMVFLLLPMIFSLLIPSVMKMDLRIGIIRGLVTRTSVWSYSLYLCHIPVFKIFHLLGSESLQDGYKVFMKVAAIACSFVVAAITYTVVEKPIMALRPKESF